MNPKPKNIGVPNAISAMEGFDTIMRSLQAGVCRVDRSGFVLYVNEAATVMLGQEEPELLGVHYSKMFFGKGVAPDDPRCGPFEFTLNEAESSHINTENLVRGDGSDFLAELICVPAEVGSEFDGAVISFMDVTDRRLVEKEVSNARDKAVDAARSKADFLANMSHEIRTPLTGIIGTVDLLAGTDLDDEQKQFLSILRTSTELLRGIVNEILDFSKIEAGKFVSRRESFLPRRFSESVAESFRPLAAEKDLDLVVEFQDALPEIAECDVRCLQQVLNNLLSNALKFTESGTVLLRLEIAESGDRLRYIVRDTGIGIADSEKKKLFAPFEQANSSDARRFDGTGLGLAISRRLLLLMGGDIGYSSVEGIGSEFWAEIPFKLPEPVGVSGEELKDNAANQKGVRILVVEDNPVNLLVTRRILEQIGVDVVSARSGIEAVEKCRDKDFDLVLLDCQMPDVDGYETAKRIRKKGVTCSIIAFTASVAENESEKFTSSGMDGVLLKPFTKDELIEVIETHRKPHKRNKNLDLNEYFIEHSISKFIEPDTLRQLVSIDAEPRGFLREILGVFAGHFVEKLTDLESAIKGKDLSLVKSTAHNLKGSSANLGLTKLSGLLQTMEDGAPDAGFDELGNLLHKIKDEFGQIRESLAELEEEENL